jgi:surface protein
MREMFKGAKSFNQPLEKWDVSNVTNMNFMFDGASSFNQPLEKWDVSKVKEKEDIFKDAVAMKNLPSWLNNNTDNNNNIEDNDKTISLELTYHKYSTAQYSVNDNISDIDEVINAFEDGDIDTLFDIAECGWLCPAVCPIWDDPVNIYYAIKSGDKELSKGTLTVDSNDEFDYGGNELMDEPCDPGDDSYILISVEDLKWSVSTFDDVSSDMDVHKDLLIDTTLFDNIKEDSLYTELFGKTRIQVNVLYDEEVDDQLEADNEEIEGAGIGDIALLKYNPEERKWELIYLLKEDEYPGLSSSKIACFSKYNMFF